MLAFPACEKRFPVRARNLLAFRPSPRFTSPSLLHGGRIYIHNATSLRYNSTVTPSVSIPISSTSPANLPPLRRASSKSLCVAILTLPSARSLRLPERRLSRVNRLLRLPPRVARLRALVSRFVPRFLATETLGQRRVRDRESSPHIAKSAATPRRGRHSGHALIAISRRGLWHRRCAAPRQWRQCYMGRRGWCFGSNVRWYL